LSSFIDPQTPDIYPLSLHDALPIFELAVDPAPQAPRVGVADGLGQQGGRHVLVGDGPLEPLDREAADAGGAAVGGGGERPAVDQDRKSTRLNSSHVAISYAVFCLKK